MLFSEFDFTSGSILFEETISSVSLEVRESSHYRWFHYGGNVVQSMMDTEEPHRVLSPVSLSMLLFLLWQNKPVSLLNLGIGGGSFERALVQYNNIDVTSVESEVKIIEMAQAYFSLPQICNIVHALAEDFLQKNSCYYDVILCDIFFNDKSPLSLYCIEFYEQLYRSLSDVGIAFINVHPESEADLVQLLHLSRECFDHVALIEFDDFANIIMVLSLQKLPSQSELHQKNKNSPAILPGNFAEIIEKIHFLPIKKR
jgi:spermidine synthase